MADFHAICCLRRAANDFPFPISVGGDHRELVRVVNPGVRAQELVVDSSEQ